ncbi:Glucose-induced degradation protein 4 [Tetrabaena socialis]|uniref:Glucose-induced degradation protein 4 n=1 Tax=Tetrabaena socialis TaxID=47790 RepID=A0A2J7ZQI9_9CHLO|nr:Glucose-induced degradation protein 4 [Tetrabaena socialis]|eukprot:PNH02535.1 Glucose-induced degradation protein 4 [Tetrabaena socialis]
MDGWQEEDVPAFQRHLILPRLARLAGALRSFQSVVLDTSDLPGPFYRDESLSDGADAEQSDDGMEVEEEEQEEEQEEQEEAGPSPRGLRPSSCSFLMPGRVFVGSQRLHGAHREQEDHWAVTATLYGCDFSTGVLCGSMVAQSTGAKKPIVTFWEGEIVDNVNHTLFTGRKWGACPSQDTDLRHWGRCPGFSGAIRAQALAHGGRSAALCGGRHVFMRWKECFFVDVPQVGVRRGGYDRRAWAAAHTQEPVG